MLFAYILLMYIIHICFISYHIALLRDLISIADVRTIVWTRARLLILFPAKNHYRCQHLQLNLNLQAWAILWQYHRMFEIKLSVKLYLLAENKVSLMKILYNVGNLKRWGDFSPKLLSANDSSL